MPTIVLSPFNVVNFPEGGGHWWVYMQYAEGLRQLGCDVYWLENFRRSGNPELDEVLLSAFSRRMEGFGMAGKIVLYANSSPVASGGLPQEYLDSQMQRRAAELGVKIRAEDGIANAVGFIEQYLKAA